MAEPATAAGDQAPSVTKDSSTDADQVVASSTPSTATTTKTIVSAAATGAGSLVSADGPLVPNNSNNNTNDKSDGIITKTSKASSADGDALGDGERKLRARLERAADSLGWLTESTIQPKKQKVIEGVSGKSIVDLKVTSRRFCALNLLLGVIVPGRFVRSLSLADSPSRGAPRT